MCGNRYTCRKLVLISFTNSQEFSLRASKVSFWETLSLNLWLRIWRLFFNMYGICTTSSEINLGKFNNRFASKLLYLFYLCSICRAEVKQKKNPNHQGRKIKMEWEKGHRWSKSIFHAKWLCDVKLFIRFVLFDDLESEKKFLSWNEVHKNLDFLAFL